MAAHGIPWEPWKRPNAPPDGGGNDAIRIPWVRERSMVAHEIPWGPWKRPNAPPDGGGNDVFLYF